MYVIHPMVDYYNDVIYSGHMGGAASCHDAPPSGAGHSAAAAHTPSSGAGHSAAAARASLYAATIASRRFSKASSLWDGWTLVRKWVEKLLLLGMRRRHGASYQKFKLCIIGTFDTSQKCLNSNWQPTMFCHTKLFSLEPLRPQKPHCNVAT